MEEKKKDFDNWNETKKRIDNFSHIHFFHDREIWWCSLGINIGVEINGKGNGFERPVLILKKFNKYMALVIPFTTNLKNTPFHFNYSVTKTPAALVLSHMKVVSVERLLRKVGYMDKDSFNELKKRLLAIIV